MDDVASTAADWHAWQQSWDRQQEWYLPDREERFRTMLDMVEALVGTAPRILDLACGTGSITGRALERFPDATSTGVDLDPALLAIARGSFEGDARAGFVPADLRDPAWAEALPYDSYDAVLTATALHWLHEDDLARLYGRIGSLVRPGGVFLNADHMPHAGTPRIDAAEHDFRHARMGRAKEGGALDWSAWWERAAQDPALAAPTAERNRIYGTPTTRHTGDLPDAGRHVELLLAGGFDEARVVWASPADSMVLALR